MLRTTADKRLKVGLSSKTRYGGRGIVHDRMSRGRGGSKLERLRYSLTVRIGDFPSLDPGSTPGIGTFFFVVLTYYEIGINYAERTSFF